MPFTSAEITDIQSRLFARRLEAGLGRAVTIDNRPGAGGTAGTKVGARAMPDGYTLLYGTAGVGPAHTSPPSCSRRWRVLR
ncbi:tripartite tricarboxylate transporter substrate-binding protein [Pseudoroseomonas ludipueritiae]|uniref:Uncharacterized protein n=1 Tax=Pseudoroseomonas ludipueritiae TaxID=198093 RepID=A0ABR7R5R2_9PROT|nr:hypothetical protein [Pseudoroseomonas ludipueritiae]